jgi:hypothetical protein
MLYHRACSRERLGPPAAASPRFFPVSFVAQLGRGLTAILTQVASTSRHSGKLFASVPHSETAQLHSGLNLRSSRHDRTPMPRTDRRIVAARSAPPTRASRLNPRSSNGRVLSLLR